MQLQQPSLHIANQHINSLVFKWDIRGPVAKLEESVFILHSQHEFHLQIHWVFSIWCEYWHLAIHWRHTSKPYALLILQHNHVTCFNLMQKLVSWTVSLVLFPIPCFKFLASCPPNLFSRRVCVLGGEAWGQGYDNFVAAPKVIEILNSEAICISFAHCCHSEVLVAKQTMHAAQEDGTSEYLVHGWKQASWKAGYASSQLEHSWQVISCTPSDNQLSWELDYLGQQKGGGIKPISDFEGRDLISLTLKFIASSWISLQVQRAKTKISICNSSRKSPKNAILLQRASSSHCQRAK